MKRLLALFLAVAMLAAGNVLALAEEPAAAGDTPTITDGEKTYNPGETISTSWSIYFPPDSSKGFVLQTEKEVKSCTNVNPNISVEARVRDNTDKLIVFSIKNPSTSEEDVGKILEDTITIVLKDGESEETFSFGLAVRYRSGIVINQVGAHTGISRFILGETKTLSFEITDPRNMLVLPYEVEIGAETMNEETIPNPEDWLLQIGEVQTDGKKFSFPVTPVKAGNQRLHVYVIGADGTTGGKGWDYQVSADGNFSEWVKVGATEDNSPTDNAANSNETAEAIREAAQVLTSGAGELPKSAVSVSTASGATMTAIPVKLSSGSAALSVDTANTLGENAVALSASVDNGAMEVILPGGFGQVSEPGRIYYPLDLNTAPSCAEEMKAAVKGNEDTRTETVKAGGDMVLPTTATITLKTKLEGRVNIYYYNEETRRFTKLATASPADGKVTFATRQMGHLVLTTGTI